jgi:hypothetical protein
VNLIDCQFDHGFIHPFSHFQGLDETVLDVVDDLVAEVPRFGRKGLFNEETAQDPAKAIVNVSNTGSPSFLGGVWLLL